MQTFLDSKAAAREKQNPAKAAGRNNGRPYAQ
jgi:hypothetical protein